MPELDLRATVDYGPRTAVAGLNGSVVVFVSCPRCGAALVSEVAADGTDAVALHAAWHADWGLPA